MTTGDLISVRPRHAPEQRTGTAHRAASATPLRCPLHSPHAAPRRFVPSPDSCLRPPVSLPDTAQLAHPIPPGTAGLTLEWSNGVTEGQIHRLKLVKRQAYGRAGFTLLRQRVLQAA